MPPIAVFTASDGANVPKVWATDGTAGGTRALATEIAGGGVTYIGGVGYFLSPDGQSTPYGPEQQLWRTDGTIGGTYSLGVAAIGALSVAQMGGLTYYLGSDANHREALFASDGVNPGHFVAALNANPTLSFNASFMGQIGGRLLINVSNTVWVSDGTSSGTHVLDDGQQGSSLGFASDVAAANGKLYFTASDGVHGTQLWQTDGVTTTAVSSSIVGANVGSPVAVNDHLVFISGSSLETWDGVSANATPLQANLTNTYEYFLQDGKLFFDADPGAGVGLFVTDGTVGGTQEIAAGSYAHVAATATNYVLTGSGNSNVYVSDGAGGATLLESGFAYELGEAGGKVFFDLNGNQLWVTDGTLAGTKLLVDGFNTRDLTTVGSNLVFTASTDGINYEPWISDGTIAGTHQIADLVPRLPGALAIGSETAVGNGFAFFASAAGADPVLWVSDGTAGGTKVLLDYPSPSEGPGLASQLVYVGGKLYYGEKFANLMVTADLATAPAPLPVAGLNVSEPQFLTAFNGELFFYESNIGTEAQTRFGVTNGLFATDGTDGGTSLISGAQVWAQPIVLNGNLIFYGWTFGGSDPAGLYRSNGAAGGTVFLGGLPSTPQDFTVSGTNLFFTDGDSSTGRELWVSNGAVGGAHLVKDIAAGAQTSSIGPLTPFGAGVVFTASDLTHGQQLWFSDGTTNGTFQVDINQTLDATASLQMSSATSFGGKTYFIGNDGIHGDQLWVSDGTTAGTKVVTPLDPLETYPANFFFGSLNGKLIFTDWGKIWITDGTAAGTAQIQDSAFDGADDPTILDGKLYFEGTTNAAPGFSAGIFATNGTSFQKIAPSGVDLHTAGDYLFYYGSDQAHGPGIFSYGALTGTTTFLTSMPNFFGTGGVTLGSKFIYGDPGLNDSKIWVSDGTLAGTKTLVSIPQNQLFFSHLTLANGKVYFESFGTGGGLWSTDGTVAGTHEVVTVEMVGGEPLTAAGTKLYYVATDSTHGQALWAYNTVAGTTALVVASATAPNPDHIAAVGTGVFFTTYDSSSGFVDLWHVDSTNHVVKLTSPTNGASSEDPNGFNMATLGSSLVFGGSDSVHGAGLFVSNGTTVTFLKAVNYIHNFSVIGGKLYFEGNDAANGDELWVSDGTVAGTHRVTDTELPNSANISAFVTLGSKIYFSANDGVHGQELWSFNGQAGGAAMVADLTAGAAGSNPTDLTVMGGALYFAADSGGTRELWRSNGTAGGTQAITTAANGAHPDSLFAMGSELFFFGSDSTHGSGLFVTDGTAGGTTFLRAFSAIADFSAAGGHVTFDGTDASGAELWTTDGTAAGTVKLTSTGVDPGSGAGGYTVVSGLDSHAQNDFNGDGVSDLLIKNTNGALVLGQVSGGQAGYSQIGALGSEWTFRGDGQFLGDGKTDFLIESTSGVVVVGELGAGNQLAYTAVGALGPEWTFRGVGDFLGDGKADFLIENTAGVVVVGEVGSNHQAAYTAVAALGSEWSFRGAGDFFGDGKDDFLIQNTSGVVVVGEVGANHQPAYTTVAALGAEWSFREVGDFLGNGKDDFVIQNSSGGVVIGEVGADHQVAYTGVGGLGSEWKFLGAGDYLGEGHDQLLIENTSGAVLVADVQASALHFTQIGALGSEWAFH